MGKDYSYKTGVPKLWGPWSSSGSQPNVVGHEADKLDLAICIKVGGTVAQSPLLPQMLQWLSK